MQNFRLKILILLSLILSNENTFGQTYIGPIIGYDYAQIQSNFNEGDFYYTVENGYVNKSPVIGIKIEQYFYNFLYFSFQSTYSHKYVITYTTGFDPVFGITFNYFQQYFSIRYKLLNSIYFGIGFNYNFVNDISVDLGNNYKYPLNFNDNEKGIHFSGGIKFLNFDLELYYYKSSNRLNRNIFDIMKMEPISSYGINLSYDIKVFDRIMLFDKKGQSCPAF